MTKNKDIIFNIFALPSYYKLLRQRLRSACSFKGESFFRGFTLIELLVVVLIIAILAAVALPQYQKVVLKSRYVQLMTFGNAVYQASTRYYLEQGQYPTSWQQLDITLPNTLGATLQHNDFRCTLAFSQWNHLSCYFDVSQGRLGYVRSTNDSSSCLASVDWARGNALCQQIAHTDSKRFYGAGSAASPFMYQYTIQ